MWEDIGNYYGAGANGLNWRENQYDYILKSGKIEGDEVNVVRRSIPKTINDGDSYNELKTGKPGSGDNAYGYFVPRSSSFYLRGTIPPKQDSFSISLSSYSPAWGFFYYDFNAIRNFEVGEEVPRTYEYFESIQKHGSIPQIFLTYHGLDSIANR